ncbi:hypothetical protein [Peribacillus aracenensis]|uniref:hypothetical protein n=1 Tax=Peribacillus aracenensis TaxID=2976708 RepID=UPI0021A7E008|nr:hypothetical protein [Peribacillus sp. BBB004]
MKIEAYIPGETQHGCQSIIYLFGDMIFLLEQKNLGINDEANKEAWPNTMKILYIYIKFENHLIHIENCAESWKMN